MKFSEFLPSTAVVKELQTTGKKDVIREMVEKIKDVFGLPGFKVNDVVDLLMKREKIGSTGIGNGIAVPHAKIDGLDKVVGAFGRSTDGIEFNAVDGMPVYLAFLILAPADKPEANLAVLQHISRAIKQQNFCKFLKSAKDVKAIADIFNEADELLK
jgi:mannitol/fructose-specific phosphotransferase system IIA component (Ntr-type)